jgi:hypothetical protein
MQGCALIFSARKTAIVSIQKGFDFHVFRFSFALRQAALQGFIGHSIVNRSDAVPVAGVELRVRSAAQ